MPTSYEENAIKEILRSKPSNCKNCYKCIRHCPVKAIRFSAGQAHVAGDEYILCGQCFAVCPQNAKQIFSDLEKARGLLMSAPVYASIAPSFAAAVIQGKAELSMCLPYMMKRAEGFSDTVVANSPNGILVLNDDLEVQRINPEACRLLRIRNKKDVLGDHINRLMEPDTFQKVRGKRKPPENERTYLTECECFVDRTILYNSDCRL